VVQAGWPRQRRPLHARTQRNLHVVVNKRYTTSVRLERVCTSMQQLYTVQRKASVFCINLSTRLMGLLHVHRYAAALHDPALQASRHIHRSIQPLLAVTRFIQAPAPAQTLKTGTNSPEPRTPALVLLQPGVLH
jgi:hypothetical protein